MTSFIVYNSAMTPRKRFQQAAALVVLLLSVGLLAWGFWPFPPNAQALVLEPADLQIPTTEAAETPFPSSNNATGGLASSEFIQQTPMPTTTAPSLPEGRRLELTYPLRIRQGDSANIHLSFGLDNAEAVGVTATFEGTQVFTESVQVVDLYATHRILAQARLDLAGIESVPAAGQFQLQPLLPGEEISFNWSIRSTQIASYSGVVWFSLVFEPLDGGPAVEKVLAAQPVEIECVNFVGLGGTPARLMGGVGILLGVILSRDTTADFLKKYRRSRKSRSTSSRKSSSRKQTARKSRGR